MHKEILNSDQLSLLPLVTKYKREFYLVGGTAIALHIGHRKSIDFDLFKFTSLNRKKIIEKISHFTDKYTVTRNVEEQLNLNIQNVKFTFFEYPYQITANCNFENIIKMPDLLSLASMKAFALGRRSKWKDYVDLYFIIKDFHTIDEISNKAKSIYGEMFSEKQFRAQLTYFDDIDYSEQVEYCSNAVSVDEIKLFLIKISVEL